MIFNLTRFFSFLFLFSLLVFISFFFTLTLFFVYLPLIQSASLAYATSTITMWAHTTTVRLIP